MALTKGALLQPQDMSTVERDLLSLAGADVGRLIYNTTDSELQLWDGSAWQNVAAGAITVDAANITGQIVDAQIAGMSSSKLIGQVTDAQIAGMAATKLTGQVTNAQITSLDAAKLFGVADGGSY